MRKNTLEDISFVVYLNIVITIIDTRCVDTIILFEIIHLFSLEMSSLHIKYKNIYSNALSIVLLK